MTLAAALRTGLPVRRRSERTFIYENYPWSGHGLTYIVPNSWMDPEWMLSAVRMTKLDILATDWEVKREVKKRKR